MTMRIDISIGPVQGFVGQSRRTRDLWGSSYLLALLSAHAMRGAKEAGGKIVQPNVEDDQLFKWVCGDRKGGAPRIGSVPNHFVVEVEGDDIERAAEVSCKGKEALDKAWVKVCDAVWNNYVEHAAGKGNGTKGIWQRQVEGFWEVSWTAGRKKENGEKDDGGNLLARRKHWRSHSRQDEPGDKCFVMFDLQELSGYVRASSRESREKQNDFWDAVRSDMGALDIQENERLSAIALVKRLFPRVSEDAIGWKLADAVNWQSTSYIAAVPWIRRILETENLHEQARKYADLVDDNASNALSEWPDFDKFHAGESGRFRNLDANYLHVDSLRNEQVTPLNGNAAGKREELIESLRRINASSDKNSKPLGAPSKFYALLLADGDKLGALVGKLGGEQVGKALEAFTRSVPQIVRKYDGVTVYAGGDDVLAMLPVEGALKCAEELSKKYRSAFKKVGLEEDSATLSAGVVFAHIHSRLSEVISEAHPLLDDVAKDDNGRNSLVVSVQKGSGQYCQWATSWLRPHANDLDANETKDIAALKVIDDLTECLMGTDSETGLSASLIYRIRETLALLCGWDRWEPGSWGAVPEGIDVKAAIRAEIFHSLQVRMRSEEQPGERAGKLAGAVWNALARSKSKSGEGNCQSEKLQDRYEIGVDGMMLARFLANPDEEAGR